MPKKDANKDVLGAVNQTTGKNITEKDINKLASTVTPSTTQNEAQLRELIKKVAALVNVKVEESTVKDIIKAVKSSNLDGSSMSTLMGLLMKKK
ncbi:stage VI sporulation protein F [Paenibacillus sp. N1-5-1-14]|uniref:stage VI sporulation protein F n=1 Tax=Paenibacillus radicibacter TaxID=2972488 RepID=UPI002158DA69|nr:stage VI sporulation protein F [Paenibacillus radicibacter]MCR8642307.1 stage VI sporulation protein F [Paenibacillus radicibacter]